MSFSNDHIYYLERAFLDEQLSVDAPQLEWPSIVTGSLDLVQIVNVPRIDEASEERNNQHQVSVVERMIDSLSGVHDLSYSIVYAIVGRSAKVSLFMATALHPAANNQETEPEIDTGILSSLLNSAYPGIKVNAVNKASNLFDDLTYGAMITGTPTLKSHRKYGVDLQIDRLIRSLYGSNWAYVVVARPIELNYLQQFASQLLYELQLVADAERSAKNANPKASKYKQLLNRLWNKIQLGKAQGMWHGLTYLLADNPQTIVRAKASAKSVFSGASSTPDPIRILDSKGIQKKVSTFALPHASPNTPPGKVYYSEKFLSLLNSSELSAMVHLPLREVSGFNVQPQARFDVTLHKDPDIDEGSIKLGEIVDRGQETGNQYKVSLNSLRRHGMVVGTTGSGKTNTIFNILRQLAAINIPFLVIEPAKTEYRALLESELGSHLQIFTLGNEIVSPFRINPFEILPGISAQNHIDYLKSLFNASFVMYSPMPQVLEQCIHEVYEDKGWNLVTGENERGHHPNAYPTLTDLHQKITEIVYQLGYEHNIIMNINAALRTRINSLRIGAKGLMLDTKVSFSIDLLLKAPTILELDNVGDDDEKAFLIGLILMRLYEHYRSIGQLEGGGLRHVTIIEEAHRLLKSSPPATDPEAATMTRKAVESFASMLAEVRAYGEGFVVAEQIPSKLASDVIKNTNLKIVHRLVAEEDRKLVGGTMGLNPEQERWAGLSQVGEAAVFSEIDDNPLRIKIPYQKIQGFSTGQDSDRKVAEMMQGLKQKFHTFNSDQPVSSSILSSIRKNIDFQVKLSRFILSIVIAPEVFSQEFQYVKETAKELFSEIARMNEETIKGVLLQGLDYSIEEIGRKCITPFAEVQNLKLKLLAIIRQSIDGDFLVGNSSKELLNDFSQEFSDLFIDYEAPYAGCKYVCQGKGCIYRFLIQDCVELHDYISDETDTNNSDIAKIYSDFQKTCLNLKKEIINDEIDEAQKTKATLCLSVQLADKSYSAIDREKILMKLFPLRN